MNTTPGQFPFISQYHYNPQVNESMTLTDFADVLAAVIGLTAKERKLLLMDVGGRMTRLLPQAEAKLRAKKLWPPSEAAGITPGFAAQGVSLRELLGALDAELQAGGDEGMLAAFRAQLDSPANREAYLSVLDL